MSKSEKNKFSPDELDGSVAKRMGELSERRPGHKNDHSLKENASAETFGDAISAEAENISFREKMRGFRSEFCAAVRTRRFKRGGAAALLTVLFLLFLVLTNLVTLKLTERYAFLSPDLTKNKIYTLSDVTIDLVENLDMRVEIDIIASEANCMNTSVDLDPYGHIPLATELIKRYEQYSDNLRVQFIDLSTYPGFLDLVDEYRDSIFDYSVVIRSPLRTRVTSFYEMLPSLTASASTDSVSTDLASSLTETVISSLIKTVTISTVPTVAYLDCLGGGDYIDYLLTELSINGYDIYTSNEFNFGYEPIPDDVQTVIIAAPQYDLTQSQLLSLTEFLENGGNYGKSLLCFTSSFMPDMPNLSTLLEEWGITVNRSYVYEGDTAMRIPTMGADVFYSTMRESEYITDTISEKFIPVAGAVELGLSRQNVDGSIVVNPVLSTTGSGYTAPIGKDFNADNADPADAAVRYIMAEATLYKSLENGSQLRGDVIVAPVSLCHSDYIGASNYSNHAFLLRVCNLRCGITDETLNIESKMLSSVDFSVTNGAVIAVTIILGYALPLAVLVFGLVIYFRRKHL